MNSYELSRNWFDFCFENPEKIKPNHTAVYFFAIEHCNRLGWKEKYGFPTTMAMEAVGIKSYNTYINTFNDLVEWRFIKVIQRSKNQYSANIIALSNFNRALDKALDKALIKHGSKQSESTGESIDSINKQVTIKQTTKEHKEIIYPTLDEFLTYCVESIATDRSEYLAKKQSAILKYKSWEVDDWHKTIGGKRTKIKNWKTTILNTWKWL
jgi:hypothetical protein